MPRGKGITGDVQEAVSHQPCNGSKANSKQSAVHRSTVRRLLTRQKRSIAVFQKTAKKKKNRERFFVSISNVKVHDGTIRKNCSNMACLEGFPGESTFFLKRKVASQRNISIKDFGIMLFSKSVN